MSRKKILLIDNQQRQFKEIANKLSDFDVLPEQDNTLIIDAVRIFLANRYPSSVKREATRILSNYVNTEQFDLYIIDFKLTGNDDGEDGIRLATKLRKFQTTKHTVPVLFLSGHARGEETVSKNFEQMEVPKEWVEKGYASIRLVDDDYFELHVLSAIERLLGSKEELEKARLLSKLFNDNELMEVRKALIPMKSIYEETGTISEYDFLFLKRLDTMKKEGKIDDDRLHNIAEDYLKQNKKK